MLDRLRVDPGSPAAIAARDPADQLGLEKHEGERRLEELDGRIDDLQYRLYAEGRRSVLLILQGLDASGKDGVIRRVFVGVNPIGLELTSFGVPAGAEVEHDYLWRIHAALPARGKIGVFNRSHYEDVVAVRMRELAPEAVWRRRYEHIRAFERMLVDEGTAIVKVFLNVSREEQRARLQERIDDPRKRWKFRRDDLGVRERFADWIGAWDDALTETSTDWAPWHVVPADRNWLKALAVAELLCATLERLDPRAPRAGERARGASYRVGAPPPRRTWPLRTRPIRTIDSGLRVVHESSALACPSRYVELRTSTRVSGQGGGFHDDRVLRPSLPRATAPCPPEAHVSHPCVRPRVADHHDRRRARSPKRRHPAGRGG